MAKTYPSPTTEQIAQRYAAAVARIHELERALVRVLLSEESTAVEVGWARAEAWALVDSDQRIRTRARPGVEV